LHFEKAEFNEEGIAFARVSSIEPPPQQAPVKGPSRYDLILSEDDWWL